MLAGDGRYYGRRPVNLAANGFAAFGLEPDERRRRDAIAAIGLGAIKRPVGKRQQRRQVAAASLAMATPTLTVGVIARSANCSAANWSRSRSAVCKACVTDTFAIR